MQDQRIEKGSLLDLEDAGQPGWIEPVRSKAVDGFRGQADDLALSQERDSP